MFSKSAKAEPALNAPLAAYKLPMSIISPMRHPSERRFGITLAAGLAILGVRGTMQHWSWIAYGSCFTASIVCVLLTYAAPRALAPLNRAGFYLSQQFAKVLSSMVLAVIFFGILTPIAVVARLFGRDELRLKCPDGNSYWIDRAPPAPAAESFRNQF